MSEPALEVIPQEPRIVGSICANKHARISHRESKCPLCEWVSLANQLGEAVEALRDHILYQDSQILTLKENREQ